MKRWSLMAAVFAGCVFVLLVSPVGATVLSDVSGLGFDSIVAFGDSLMDNGNANDYFFFTDIHPTTAVHALVVPEPATLIVLMTGSCLVLRGRKKQQVTMR